jgi:hypothetical protein
MIRHDLIVQTAAPHRLPTGLCTPGASATMSMHSNLINTVAAEAQMPPARRPPGSRATAYAEVSGPHSSTPNPKTP